MDLPHLSPNSVSDTEEKVASPIPALPILTILGITAVISILIGATGMWIYQKITQIKPSSISLTQKTSTASATTSPTPVASPTTSPTPVASPAAYLPTVQAIPSLKEYTSSRNPYVFSYPADKNWQVFVTPGEMEESVAVSCESCKDAQIDIFQVSPVIFTSIEEYMEKDILTTDKTNITLNGLPAIRGVQSGDEQVGGSWVAVFVVKNKKGYLLQQRYANLYNKTKFSEIPQVETDILASFKLSDK